MTLFLLLLATSGEAGEIDTQTIDCRIWVDQVLGPMMEGADCPQGSTLNGKHIKEKSDCLAKMEAAMRAMEPFMDKWELNEWGDVLYTLAERRRYVITEFTTEQFKAYAKAHMDVMKLWTDAKGCWRGK